MTPQEFAKVKQIFRGMGHTANVLAVLNKAVSLALQVNILTTGATIRRDRLASWCGCAVIGIV